jgi:hypothetical protein
MRGLRVEIHRMTPRPPATASALRIRPGETRLRTPPYHNAYNAPMMRRE